MLLIATVNCPCHTAEVHRMALNPCQLHCIANNSTLLSNIGPVLDGTHCWSHRNDVCIQGECVTVGCDLQLNSGMILDQCGVCGGNGSSCITVSREILTGNQIGNVWLYIAQTYYNSQYLTFPIVPATYLLLVQCRFQAHYHLPKACNTHSPWLTSLQHCCGDHRCGHWSILVA